MTNYREILRLHSLGLNKTEIAASLHCVRNTVAATLQRAGNCGLQWSLPDEISDKRLADLLFPSAPGKPAYKMPDYAYVYREMQKSGMTLNLLWLEYCDQCKAAGEIPYQSIHKIIFGGIYEWAGEVRTIPILKAEEVLGGDSVRYAMPGEIKKQLDLASKEIAKLKPTENKKELLFKIVRITASIWQTHPFREGNTRSVISFSVLLAAKLGIKLDYVLFAKYAAYVRNALVWCTQGIYSKYEYLEKIYFDAAGLLDAIPSVEASKGEDYSVIEGYRVANYKEQPHTYAENSK